MKKKTKVIIDEKPHNDEKWNEFDINKDGVIDKEEVKAIHDRIDYLKNLSKRSLSSWRLNKIKAELSRLQTFLPKDDLTITY